VIKALGPLLAAAPCTAGAALIGERMVLVIDLADVATRALAGNRPGTRLRPRATSTTRAKVLVAEDSPLIRDAIRRELARAGFDVTVAEDGEQALRLALEGHFDAISSDVMMPKLDGYEVTRRIRAADPTDEMPVILLTARVQDVDIARGFDAGADDYMKKPFSPLDLRARVEALLGQTAGPQTRIPR
jgi:CheY-like chemotaxis protein